MIIVEAMGFVISVEAAKEILIQILLHLILERLFYCSYKNQRYFIHYINTLKIHLMLRAKV
jgi:hypothetical protein